MHELALCDAMLKMVRDISREQALEGVRSITVRVGTLSGVVPRFLTDPQYRTARCKALQSGSHMHTKFPPSNEWLYAVSLRL